MHRWREANGGLLHTSIRATGWMFGALFFSYVAEFLMLFLVRPSASGRALLPIFTYSPLAFAWLWRHRSLRTPFVKEGYRLVESMDEEEDDCGRESVVAFSSSRYALPALHVATMGVNDN